MPLTPDYSAHYPTKTGEGPKRKNEPLQCARDLQVWPCEVEQARDYGAKLQRRITRALAELEGWEEFGLYQIIKPILEGQEE
jgi:hypothetical protein